MPRVALLLVATLGLIAAAPSSVRARVVAGDAFLCAEARAVRTPRGAPSLPAFHPRVAVSAIDRFTLPRTSERYTLDLKKAEAFCWPVRLDGEEVTDPLSGLEAYYARRTRRKPSPPPLPTVTEVIETSLGTLSLKIDGVAALQVPTLATGSVGGIGPARDHFACYQVRQQRGSGERRGVLNVEVRGADTSRPLELRKPERLCVPANVRGDDPTAPKHPLDLLCFDARAPRRGRSIADGADDPLVATRNAFGPEMLHLGAPRLLCVPAVRAQVTAPSPTPFPTFTPLPLPTPPAGPTPQPARLRIEPARATGLVRDRVCFAALMELPDGSVTDLTTTTIWRVADGTFAVPAGIVDGKKCFIGLAIGSTEITARDPVTGLGSPASLTAEWPIYALTVTPDQMGLRIGSDETLTALAKLTGNRTRNVTQHVQYVTGDPTIARAANAVGNRSRIEGLGSGRTTVTVTDTLSSIAATASVVVGALQRLHVDEVMGIFPGESVRLKTTGLFDAGFKGNLTQLVTYESSDPSVVVATNAPGDRSRVEAVRAGTVLITATDPASGLRSDCCSRVGVLGDLLYLSQTQHRLEHRAGIGEPPVRLKVRGFFEMPPQDHFEREISDRVTWSSSDETVIVPDRVDVDGFERFRVVGGGVATLAATWSANGMVATTAVTIFDRLDRIDVGTSSSDPAALEARAIPIGESTRYVAHGYFDGGRHRILNAVRWAVSDPAVAQSIGDGYLKGLRPGTVTVTAVDDPSGKSSESGGRSATLQVYGDIERLVLSPQTLTLERGQTGSLTVVAHHAGGGVENVTQRVIYRSSAPTIVAAPNVSGNQSRILGIAAGTATISAIDTVTGVSSTTSGDDAIVTVHDDPLVSIVVTPRTRRVAVESSPHFTATGRLASGGTRNLTQRVQWTASDTTVAGTERYSGDRSRVDAFTPGTSRIAVRDPETGLASTDSDEDATLIVEALASLVLAPATLELTVGDAFALTTVGTVVGASPVNVTQEAFYTSSDSTIVVATNQVGNKSRIEAIAPGVVTITAFRPSTYPQATDSNAITVTVSAP